MNVLSLFSGIGGLELGLERAGMTVVGQVELDPFCRSVLAKHWPEVPRHDDVRTCVDWWRGESRPPVHVVAGGYPCQPFSTAGRQQGTADERWGWPWFYRVVCALRPRYVLVENVAALLADRDAVGWMLGDLAALGYDAEWDCVPAAAVGAPHRRDRLFLVAYPQRVGLRHEPEPVAGSGGASVVVDDGAAWALDNADGPAGRSATGDALAGDSGAEVRGGPAQPRRRGDAVADADGERLEGRRIPEAGRDGKGADARGGGPRIFRGTVRPGGEWTAEPAVGRVAHGLPARVVRPELRGLGNAVVPQVAEHIGRLIVAADMASEVAA